MLAATTVLVVCGFIVADGSGSAATPTTEEAATPTSPACEGRFGPIGDLAEPGVSLSPLDAGRVLVHWTIPQVGEEPTCFVIERRVGDAAFEVVAVVSYRTGWLDPTIFHEAGEVAYRVYAANDEARSDSDEATINIPAHTPFVTPSTTLRGDVDCDLDVDAVDAVPLLTALAGLSVEGMSDSCYLEPEPGEVFDKWHRWGRTDFNCDGLPGAYDVVVLLRYVADVSLNLHRFCQASWPS